MDGGRAKRVYRTAEEKRRIVEATLVPGASIARVVREHGVNANQVFQWRYEHRKGVGWAASQSRTELLPVIVTSEPDCVRDTRDGYAIELVPRKPHAFPTLLEQSSSDSSSIRFLDLHL